MKREDILSFTGKKVKLAYKNGFVINGTLEKVGEETVFFRTSQTISAIDIQSIASIVVKNTRGTFL